MRERKIHVTVLGNAVTGRKLYQGCTNEIAETVFLHKSLGGLGLLEMIRNHPKDWAKRFLEDLQCRQSRRMAVAKIEVINETDRFRVLMHFVDVLASRKLVPLFVRQAQDESLEFSDIDTANQEEVSGKVHNVNQDQVLAGTRVGILADYSPFDHSVEGKMVLENAGDLY